MVTSACASSQATTTSYSTPPNQKWIYCSANNLPAGNNGVTLGQVQAAVSGAAIQFERQSQPQGVPLYVVSTQVWKCGSLRLLLCRLLGLSPASGGGEGLGSYTGTL